MIKTLNKRNKRKKGGFTLIELVISLAIMAVIALIALPNLNSIKESSKIKADRQSAESIKRTVQLFIVDDTIKVGSSEMQLTFDPKEKKFVGNVAGLSELENALAHVNSPATDSNGKYEIKINNNGDNVVVKVEGKDETSTDDKSNTTK